MSMLCLVLDEAVLVRDWFKLTTLRRLCSLASIHGQLKGRSLFFSAEHARSLGRSLERIEQCEI